MSELINDYFEAKLSVDSLDITPEQISFKLGANPSSSWAKGELNAGGKPYKSNRWEYDFRPTQGSNWSELKCEIVNFLECYQSSLYSLVASNNCSAFLIVVMRKNDSHIGLNFSPNILGLFQKAGVELDINCYTAIP
jgi:hypothetical protein